MTIPEADFWPLDFASLNFRVARQALTASGGVQSQSLGGRERGCARDSSRAVKTQRVGIVPHGPRAQTTRGAIQPHPQSFYN
jgi:hypothetical protein